MIEVQDLQIFFPIKRTFLQSVKALFVREKKFIKAVNGVSFTMSRGEITGLAGESGCGKTTTGMAILGLYAPSGGRVFFEGKDLVSFEGKELFKFRRKAQLVFQDPYESLNPRFTVRRTIEEPLIINKLRDRGERLSRAIRVMKRVKLTPIETFLEKYPHELSGGERQRLCIARAIVLDPLMLVADEAVSMLDVSIRAGILNLLKKLTVEMQMATLYISHDLSLLGSVSDKIAIMYAGEIVEMGIPERIINAPCHPYTRALISAVPVPEFNRERSITLSIGGEPPDLVNVPIGCSFFPRCPLAVDECSKSKPKLTQVSDDHYIACHLVGG
jgi:peptide/nickel transport system ATP-binding protein